MKTSGEEWAERVDATTNDPERIEQRTAMTPAFTVPRKKFSAELTIRNTFGTLVGMRFNADTAEELKHQIGQVQFLSLDGEVEARQKQWRIDNGIKAPKKPMQAARESVSTEEHRTAAKELPPSFEY